MKTFILCSVLLSSALLIDAGLVRVRRDKPLSNYGSGAIGQASALNPVRTPFVAIVSETNNAPGTLGDNSDFENSFESENGIRQESSGSTVTIGADNVVVMKGSYEYIGDDGSNLRLPIPFPEIAEAVAAQIAFAAEEDAANGGSSFNSGSSFNGGFQGQSSGFQGQSSGFQGQSSGFQGQSSGFQGQSSGFNSFAAASNNLPVRASPILPSYSN
ncbi:unnamed protein product [Lepeophtheirus salmonis]|uniref:(salmon louse) hypothetical protein n=1 Tax=Lepeophtheirus salmonis TaxID=72036 RepID=A0A7R8CLR0_LEPSM|nr:unnamed protein product [Lepeophtheirus salmonis]CAF2860349.1 unnamed protein product [Lepeophtheirus salmonis]